MKFKIEIFLLLTAIILFAASAFLYSYTLRPEARGLSNASMSLVAEYPYQIYAFSLVGFGSLLMTTASFSFLKRSKPTHVNIVVKKFSEELR